MKKLLLYSMLFWIVLTKPQKRKLTLELENFTKHFLAFTEGLEKKMYDRNAAFTGFKLPGEKLPISFKNCFNSSLHKSQIDHE